MAIPAPTSDFGSANNSTVLRNFSRSDLPKQMNELSMGMSGDMEAAVAEGATMVRIGTDILGAV